MQATRTIRTRNPTRADAAHRAQSRDRGDGDRDLEVLHAIAKEARGRLV